MFTVKEVWNRVCSPENQFLMLTVAMAVHFLSDKFHFGSDDDDELLPIYFFIPSTCPAHNVTILIDFD